jgi:hypothetical protein
LTDANGKTYRLELGGREIERIAVSLLDFGSFQDRVTIQQMMHATAGAKFTVQDPVLNEDFQELNDHLAQLSAQVAELGHQKIPFFQCWFLSVPQLFVLLDGVSGAEQFRQTLWRIRHIVTGSTDAYFDLAQVRKWSTASTSSSPQ